MKYANPLISVLMPAYNCESFIKRSIESILRQTYSNLEIIIINDGSTDKTGIILDQYQDPRLVVVHKPKNEGYVKALNQYVYKARGEYIARMDADDYSLPQRFERQMEVMQRDPKIGVCGTAYSYGSWRRLRKISTFTDPEDVFTALLFQNPISHPTALMRKSVFETCGSYDFNFEYVEDLDMWDRVSRKFMITNINDVLLVQNRHSNQVSVTRSGLQRKRLFEIRKRQLSYLGDSFTDREVQLFSNLTLFYRWDLKGHGHDAIVFDLEEVSALLLKIQLANNKAKIYKPDRLAPFIKEWWLRAAERIPGHLSSRDTGLIKSTMVPTDFTRLYFMRSIRSAINQAWR